MSHARLEHIRRGLGSEDTSICTPSLDRTQCPSNSRYGLTFRSPRFPDDTTATLFVDVHRRYGSTMRFDLARRGQAWVVLRSVVTRVE